MKIKAREDMLTRKITRKGCFTALLVASVMISGRALAVDVYTDPVGFYKVTALTNSDTYASIPFTRMPVYAGLVASVAGNVITVQGNSGWSVNQFVYNPAGGQSNTYYVLMSSTNCPKEGAYYTITNNNANTLTVEMVPEDLSGVASNHQVTIIPYWTLMTAFPNGQGITPTTLPSQRKTEILFPNIDGVGINLIPAATYYYYSSHWRRVSPSGIADDQIILPDQYFIVRQSSQAPTVTFNPPGACAMKKFRIPLYTQTSTKQDNYVGLYRPKLQTLNESNLTNAFVVTTLPSQRKDELLVFDNTVQGKNKVPATYYYYSGAWRKVGTSGDVGTNEVFTPGTGVIIRKATNSVAATAIWVNSPNYTNP
jgi:uncharacterized protein (TIGR02597 family)